MSDTMTQARRSSCFTSKRRYGGHRRQVAAQLTQVCVHYEGQGLISLIPARGVAWFQLLNLERLHTIRTMSAVSAVSTQLTKTRMSRFVRVSTLAMHLGPKCKQCSTRYPRRGAVSFAWCHHRIMVASMELDLTSALHRPIDFNHNYSVLRAL